MAYPSPTIQTINAFDVDVGTVIDFNIVSGTETSQIMRSNKIFIYELNTNDLICTHLYVSTDSIHELPPRDDVSMVYASGKSYTDFANENQYYAQIQTYTDTAGTQIGSSLSLSKIFWCLPTPALIISTITTPLTLTSCNVSATYDTNILTSITTLNEISQYQFILYDSGGTQIDTSGIITDSGEQSGTSTEYTVSYNFVGLENNTSYYIILNIVTSEGMELSAQSNTFTVSISAPTLGAATAINNGCNGYISVISNLSSSYTSNITRVLVKRRDVDDLSGGWITLYSKNVESAADLNFTFIDFLNQYGKTYKYAIVPVIVQTQSGVQVEVEGGYTASNNILSEFTGVFLADKNGIQKFVAGVNYNDSTLTQSVGVIPVLGSQYPIIVSNSNVNYHSGTMTAYALDDALYGLNSTSDSLSYNAEQSNRLTRQQIVELRERIEQFLVNKSPKILKDWNGNIWLIMITDSINISWINEWGMGISTLDIPWTEIGSPLNQNDLEDSGIITIA